MPFLLIRAALFFLTAILMSPVAMGRLTSNNIDGNDINDIFQPLPEVIIGFAAARPIHRRALGMNDVPINKKGWRCDSYPWQQESKLPVCAGNTICAYLQANARGINTQPMCSCPGLNRCPLVWDSEDGHSITQGSDQYKVGYRCFHLFIQRQRRRKERRSRRLRH